MPGSRRLPRIAILAVPESTASVVYGLYDLLMGDEPVEAIADAVGYEDPGFFGRLLRRSVGLTPVQYRRRFGSMRRALQGNPVPRSAKESAPASPRAR